MTTAAGANTHCKVNLHKAYGAMQKAGQTAAGRATLSAAFKTCHPLETSADVGDLISWAQGPFGRGLSVILPTSILVYAENPYKTTI